MNDLIDQLVLLQVALPLIVIALKAASLAGLALRTTVILGLLLYSAMARIRLFPPCWTPYVLIGLHVRLWRRLHRRIAFRTFGALIHVNQSEAHTTNAVRLQS